MDDWAGNEDPLVDLSEDEPDARAINRNPILTRIARAEQLLPSPLAHSSLDVALGLEIARWS